MDVSPSEFRELSLRRGPQDLNDLLSALKSDGEIVLVDEDGDAIGPEIAEFEVAEEEELDGHDGEGLDPEAEAAPVDLDQISSQDLIEAQTSTIDGESAVGGEKVDTERALEEQAEAEEAQAEADAAADELLADSAALDESSPEDEDANEATPAAEALAEAEDVNLDNVEGSGQDGRILVGDVQEAADAAELDESSPEPQVEPVEVEVADEDDSAGNA